MKYYLVFTRLEIPLVEPQPGEVKSANIVNEGCCLCLFDITGTRVKWCINHHRIKDLILLVRKIDVITEEQLAETPAAVAMAETIPSISEGVDELVAVPA